MKSKLLKIVEPIVTVYATYANVNSIVRQYEAGNQWFLQKYFHQLYIYAPKNNVLAVEFVNLEKTKFAHKYHTKFFNIHCPALKVFSIPSYTVSENNIDIIEVIKFFIEHDSYVQLYVNRNYLSNHIDGHESHSAFIYGYDDKKEIVYASDFFMGNAYQINGSFQYNELRKAFLNAKIEYIQDEGIYAEYDRHDEICIIQYNPYFSHEFSVSQFAEDIMYYLNYKKLALNYKPIFKEMKKDEQFVFGYGVEGYELFQKNVKTAIQEKMPIDYRPICNLRDHKTVLKMKIEYLTTKEILVSNEYMSNAVDIATDANILLNLILKYNMRIRRGYAPFPGEISYYIDKIEKKEKYLLDNVLKVIG
ncbi:MAG: hypothetical protein ACOX3W_04315 [Christensenellaceae bacterium]|jgi:hypothetical protein